MIQSTPPAISPVNQFFEQRKRDKSAIENAIQPIFTEETIRTHITEYAKKPTWALFLDPYRLFLGVSNRMGISNEVAAKAVELFGKEKGVSLAPSMCGRSYQLYRTGENQVYTCGDIGSHTFRRAVPDNIAFTSLEFTIAKAHCFRWESVREFQQFLLRAKEIADVAIVLFGSCAEWGDVATLRERIFASYDFSKDIVDIAYDCFRLLLWMRDCRGAKSYQRVSDSVVERDMSRAFKKLCLGGAIDCYREDDLEAGIKYWLSKHPGINNSAILSSDSFYFTSAYGTRVLAGLQETSTITSVLGSNN